MTSMPLTSRRDRKKPIQFFYLYVILFAILLSGSFFYFVPCFIYQPLNPTGNILIYYQGDATEALAIKKHNQIYIPFDFVCEHVDPSLKWDEKNSMVIITTTRDVFHFSLGEKEGLHNLEPYTLTYPVIKEQGTIYLPLEPLNDFYDLFCLENYNDKILHIRPEGEALQKGMVIKSGKLRISPSNRAFWVGKVENEEKVSIFHEKDGWYWIETEEGQIGYLDKKRVQLAEIQTVKKEETEIKPWSPLGSPLILTWEYVGQVPIDPEKSGKASGVHVFSPTWFHLQENGLVINNADKNYVKWVHKEGGRVWALFDNSFNPELTHKFLNDAALRIKTIQQILSFLELYELDGINIDFENMYLKDQDMFVQFIAELAPLVHEQKKTLTIDVTFHSLSETWSMCYDRKRLAQKADYLMVMAYDEHGRSSPRAGSVSSLPWVEKGILKMLTEVPAEKLILGIPFYTRLWTETIDKQGKLKLDSKALSMEKAEAWIKEINGQVTFDLQSGQNYVEVKKEDSTYRMWLEDLYSIEKRIELMKKYNLAGVATWRRGFEKAEVWPAINNLVQKIR